jgi:hypothetical protein
MRKNHAKLCAILCAIVVILGCVPKGEGVLDKLKDEPVDRVVGPQQKKAADELAGI